MKQFVALKCAGQWTLTSADLLYDAGNAAPGSEIWKKLAEVMANVRAALLYRVAQWRE